MKCGLQITSLVILTNMAPMTCRIAEFSYVRHVVITLLYKKNSGFLEMFYCRKSVLIIYDGRLTVLSSSTNTQIVLSSVGGIERRTMS